MSFTIRPLCISLFAICVLFAACSREAPKRVPAFPLLGDGLSLEQSCMSLSAYLAAALENADTDSFGSFYSVLDSTAAGLGRSLNGRNSSVAAADSILAVVYHRWGIGFDPGDTVLETLLPNLVYTNKKGACLGVSLIMLMLAEKLRCPLYGVLLPGHFFCRFDNGATRFNIEPNKSGFGHPDDYYRERYQVGNRPWYDLKNLSKRETIGVLCYDAGTICLNRKRCDRAVIFFREAARTLGGLPEARGNLALALAWKGNLDSAMAVFDSLFREHPDFVNLAANYGAVAMDAHRYEKARDIFRKGLDYFPEDTTLLSGLSQAYGKLENSPLADPPEGDFHGKGQQKP
jgi:tetratricopeptide (TPR) repeat protein